MTDKEVRQLANSQINLTNYLTEAIASFDKDPASNEFQRGYLAALVEIYRAAGLNVEGG